MNSVWIVDDDASIRWVLEKALIRENISCELFSSVDDVLAALEEEQPNVLVSDIRMPGESGLVLLEKIKSQYPRLPVIIMTAFSDLDSAVSSFQKGAFDYLPKPFDIESAVELISGVMGDHRKLHGKESFKQASMGNLLGTAPKMQEIYRVIGRLSNSATTVLVNGETGTGKELVARALHQHSPRSERPFIALNMAAIPRDLLESELFGHERGAFTGAQISRKGRFEQADGGTLFLDEIGDMPFELQTRLLRVLSEGKFYRVGGVTPINVNVRVIAATHQNLEDRVKKNQFREDLFHRINVIRIKIPPLRERSEDIPCLAEFFLNKFSKKLGFERKVLSVESIKAMKEFRFPGNVRQLENFCHWLTVMAPGNTITVNDLPDEIRFPDPLTELENDTSVKLDIDLNGSNDEFWTTVLSRK
ncbi:MAG: hypothetical protein CM15mP58_17150 [Burkholderiaceae bacterium]|nr:MAG: hypothetical protein CM15mP58_17150 [Burkholderiaceae bacterium]